MRDNYLEHIFSHCEFNNLSLVCTSFRTKQELLNDAKKVLLANDKILGQVVLINVAHDFLYCPFFHKNRFTIDMCRLFDKTVRKISEFRLMIKQRQDIDFEDLFNTFVDVNWLLASQFYANQGNTDGLIALLESPAHIRKWTKKALQDLLLEQAEDYKREYQFIEESLKPKWLIFSGTCQDPNIRKYLNLPSSEKRDIQMEIQKNRERTLALYYALTATMARAEEIRRNVR